MEGRVTSVGNRFGFINDDIFLDLRQGHFKKGDRVTFEVEIKNGYQVARNVRRVKDGNNAM